MALETDTNSQAIGLQKWLAPAVAGIKARPKIAIMLSVILVLIMVGYFRQVFIDLAAPILSLAIVGSAIDALTEATLQASAGLLSFLSFDVYTVPSERELGMDDFHVYVWGPCSGIEGFGLISAFLSIYMWMFRKDLDFPKAFLLIPIGIALSWCLNVVRISTLLVIGARISPELAIDTFHSHAGWLMFTILAAGLTGATSAFGWFRKSVPLAAGTPAQSSTPKAAQVSLFADPNIAAILPFIVFMASAFLLQSFTQTPIYHYPLRVIAMAGVLILIWPYLRTLNWQATMVPALGGLVIGVAWLLTSPAATEETNEIATMFATMSIGASLGWIIARTIGTVILVPIIEEIFFRGYLLRKLDSGAFGMRLGAILISSAAFAILHQRWFAALLAGIIFALITLRRGRVSDAILAHAVANGSIAIYAILLQDWTVI